MGLAGASKGKTFEQCYSEIWKEIFEISNFFLGNIDWMHYRIENGINRFQDRVSLAKGIIFL